MTEIKSKSFTCQCGTEHSFNGPACCWDCMKGMSFAAWQTGRDEVADFLYNREFELDTRDRAADTWSMGWPEQAGFGYEGRQIPWGMMAKVDNQEVEYDTGL